MSFQSRKYHRILSNPLDEEQTHTPLHAKPTGSILEPPSQIESEIIYYLFHFDC